MGKVFLRKTVQLDLKAFSELLSERQVMEFSEGAISESHVQNWLDSVLLQNLMNNGFGTYTIEIAETNEVIGYCSLLLSKYTELPEIGYRIFPKFWGLGLATEAGNILAEFAFNRIGLSAIYAQVDPHNLRSIGVLRKLGMSFSHQIKPEGYDYADEVWVLRRESLCNTAFKGNNQRLEF